MVQLHHQRLKGQLYAHGFEGTERTYTFKQQCTVKSGEAIAGAIEHASMARILAIGDLPALLLYIRRGFSSRQRFQSKDFDIGHLTKVPSL